MRRRCAEFVPMGERGAGREVIVRLVSKLGGIEKAAVCLGVRTGLVQRFVDGAAQVPDQLLLRALDLISEPNEPTPAVLPASKLPKGRPVI